MRVKPSNPNYFTVGFLSIVCIWISALSCTSNKPNLPAITVENAWSRPAQTMHHDMDQSDHSGMAMQVNGVVYLEISNSGSAADRLLSVSSAICKTAEIHQTTMIDDRMSMRKVEGGIEIAAGSTIYLKPADYHIMLLDLQETLEPKMVFDVQLEFEKSGKIVIQSTVREP